MNRILNVKSISLQQIDFDDFSYSITPERNVYPDETLSKSIATHGILHPPVVHESSSGRYKIVAGRKRLLAFRTFHPESACASMIIPHRVPEVEVFYILLTEIQLARQLTMAEKAILLQKITTFTDEKQIVSEFLPSLGLVPNSFSIKQALRLLDLEEPILLGIHKGQIHETVAYDFVPLPSEDRMTLFEIITSLRLSSSNQKKLLNICRELAGRADTNITALLDNEEVEGILQHPDANPPQKSKNLMLWLSRKHMPRARLAAEEFSRYVAALKLPENVSVAHTPFFEDDSVILSITFSNRKSLQHAWKKISHETGNSDN